MGDNVISMDKASYKHGGIVHKVSSYGVHVRFTDGTFQVFHFNPTHHMQSPLSNLKLKKNAN